MQYVKMLREPPPRARLLSDQEKEKLWKELEKDELLLRLVTLAVTLPLRRGQIFAITGDAIDLPNGVLFAKASKGRPSRQVPLNSTATNTLRMMIDDRQFPLPVKSIRKRWRKATIAAGINKKESRRGENFTFHDLRTLQATEYIKNNVNPHIVQQLFAHSSMGITDRYIGEDMRAMQDAVNTLDPNSATVLQPTQENEDFIN
jgi:integrase